jgi:hypothetical protein
MDALWNMLEMALVMVVGLGVRLLVPLALLTALLAVLVPSIYAAGGVRRFFLRLKTR